MPRPILAVFEPQALRANMALLRRAACLGTQCWVTVKANAYGHGIEKVFSALGGAQAGQGADGFALLDLEEAALLRRLGWTGPILLLEGVFEAADLQRCAELKLWQVVHCLAQVDFLVAQSAQLGQGSRERKAAFQHRLFLKLNSGMNRLGFAPSVYQEVFACLKALPTVEEVVLMTHFACADTPEGLAQALRCFRQTTQGLQAPTSLANSAALLCQANAHTPSVQGACPLCGQWLRLGIALYGSSPDFPRHSAQYWGLEPVMSLRSRIIAVQTLQKGDAVGYGAEFIATGPMRIGIVACGYADGYPRSASGGAAQGTPVLVGGVRSRTLGRVSMDMLAVDITTLPEAGWGTEVTLWGRSSTGQVLGIDEVAAAAGTVGYELMCALAARVPFQVDN